MRYKKKRGGAPKGGQIDPCICVKLKSRWIMNDIPMGKLLVCWGIVCMPCCLDWESCTLWLSWETESKVGYLVFFQVCWGGHQVHRAMTWWGGLEMLWLADPPALWPLKHTLATSASTPPPIWPITSAICAGILDSCSDAMFVAFSTTVGTISKSIFLEIMVLSSIVLYHQSLLLEPLLTTLVVEMCPLFHQKWLP